MKPKQKNIDIYALKESQKIKAAKTAREFTDKPYSELVACVLKKFPIYTAQLKPEEFFKGINTIVSLINSLESEKIDYSIQIDNSPVDKSVIFEIKNQVDNITLESFR